jgi:5-methylcytosine-specific restriction enzyme A
MSAFLITFKPDTESKERGWPLERIKALAETNASGGCPTVPWRFANRRDCAIGDAVFLMMQGRRGPCVIGVGRVTELPSLIEGRWRASVTFDRITDPDAQVLANADDLPEGEEAQRLWSTQASGIRIPDQVAAALGRATEGPAKPWKRRASNPDWTRDELIIALSHYLTWRERLPEAHTEEIRQLSRHLRQLGPALFDGPLSATHRNENGVYMKLQNLRRLDPDFTGSGRSGLPRGSRVEAEVWNEFAGNPERCSATANAILDVAAEVASYLSPDNEAQDDLTEAPEGRLLTRTHTRRERNRKLVNAKRTQRFRTDGKLACEVCQFDFRAMYGTHGHGFIECHHLKPLSELAAETSTHVDDLALVCSNCHRMLHRSRPWLTIEQLRSMLSSQSTCLPSRSD